MTPRAVGWMTAAGALVVLAASATDALGVTLSRGSASGALVALALFAMLGLAAPLVGVALGAATAPRQGSLDRGPLRLHELFDLFPLALVLPLAARSRRPIEAALVALFVVQTMTIARVVRAEAIRLRAEDFTFAAHGFGAGALKTLSWHGLARVVGPASRAAAAGYATTLTLDLALAMAGAPLHSTTWGASLALSLSRHEVARGASFALLSCAAALSGAGLLELARLGWLAARQRSSS
jgi:ABC-type dipeptide/oligopeptide/nickel transport system permease subunit